MRIIILLGCLWVQALSLSAQQGTQWAGPDTVTCGEKGVMIGSTASCPNCCFSWTPADGLSDPKIKNPIARPKKKTTYRVVVTDANLSWKKSDEVDVDLSFGEIKFVPDHLIQGGDEFVVGTLLKNEGNMPTSWSILGDDLGCSFVPNPGDENKATFSAGSEYGKLLVKVRKDADGSCFFIDTLPVNNGVKDLKVIDKNTPNRFATTGQTLYLVGENPQDVVSTLIAIPNEGGFQHGIPDYKDDSFFSTTPDDGIKMQDLEETPIAASLVPPIPGRISDYIAGDEPEYEPQLRVIRVLPTEDPAPIVGLITKLNEWWQAFEETFNFDDILNEEPDPGPCPALDAFEFTANFEVSAKDVEVEKYASPELGVKHSATIDAGINVGGKVYHPYFTRHKVVAGFGVCSELYVGVTYGNTLHLGFSADESLPDDSWTLNDPQFEMAFTGTIAFRAVLIGEAIGYNLEASGSSSLGINGYLDYKVATKQIVAYAKIQPVTIKLEAVLLSETDMGKFEPLFKLPSKEVVLYKGYVTDPSILHTFND